jgi:hypothetical protein
MVPRSFHVLAVAVLMTLSLTRPASGESSTFIVRAVLQPGAMAQAEAKEMSSEVARIWSRYGVHVEWTSPNATTPASLVVLVSFVDRINAPGAPLGAVIRVQGRMRRVIYVSRPAIDNQLRSARPELARSFHDKLFGRLAGRVIAHELGHLLLDSAAHSTGGLMRARFVHGDVMVGTGSAYALTSTQRLQLEGRLAGNAATTTVAWNGAEEDWQLPPW